MWVLVTILAVGTALSAVWLVGAIAIHLVHRGRGRADGWISGGMRRALIMTVASAACAAAIHFGATRFDGFARQMPVALLRLDVARPWYGGIALRALNDRAVQHTLSFESAARITETLLDSNWWLEPTTRTRFDPSREPERWLTIQMEQARLSDGQLARWINLVPPPLFLANADTRESPSAVRITAIFGREWQRIDNVPYRVHRLEIDAIRINGAEQSFTVEEGEDSNAAIGWYATRVVFHVMGLTAPETGEPRCEIEIVYRLDLEPSSYRHIGPLTWRTTLLVN